MVMTILEGRVAGENWSVLEEAFQKAADHEEPGLLRSYLVHSMKDVDLWRILTVWSSREALEAMRQTAETPTGILIFRKAQSEPTLSVYDITQQITQG